MAVGDPFFQLLKCLNFWKTFMACKVLGWQVFFLLYIKDVGALILDCTISIMGCKVLGWQGFFLSYVEDVGALILDCIVSNRKSAAVLIFAPLYVLRPLLRFFLTIGFKQFDYDKLEYNFIYLVFTVLAL